MTGLTAEAHVLRQKNHVVFVGGGTPEGAAKAAEAAIKAGAKNLISFGLAGGLDPALSAGDVLRPRHVLWHGQNFIADGALLNAFGGANCATLLAHTAILAHSAEKQAFWRQTGACAVDMESGAVAEVATRHGIGFAVLRAVCDPASRTLPPAALAALDNAGRIGFLAVAASVIRHPGQIPALLGLAADASRARKTLISQVKHLAPLPQSAVSPQP